MTFQRDHIIYLAGIIDGEGTVSVEKHSPKKGRKYPTYLARLTISNTNKDLIDWIYYNFGGGTVKAGRAGSLGSKTCYTWRAFGQRMSIILETILPFSIVKREQIKNVIEFRKTVGKTGQHVSQDMRDHRDLFYLKSRKLNSGHSSPSALSP